MTPAPRRGLRPLPLSSPRLALLAWLSLLASCTPIGAPILRRQSSTEATSTTDRALTPGVLPPREGAAEISRKLEEKFQRGELETFTPVGFELRTTTADGKTAGGAVPGGAPQARREAERRLGRARRDHLRRRLHDTGVPGPDTGVIYRKDPGAAVRIVYTKPENELGSVWGLSASDVYASGNKVLAHWDGKSWSEIPLTGVEGAVRSVWGAGSDVWIITGSGKQGFIYRRTAGGPWTKEATTPCFLLTIHGAGQSVWAGGSCGKILRRDKSGTWSEERKAGREVMHLWAGSEREVYAAAVDFLQSDGGGSWSTVDLPTGRIYRVTGAAPGDAYALGTQGLFRSSGKGWTKMALDVDACTMVLGKGGAVTCFREKRVVNKPGKR